MRLLILILATTISAVASVQAAPTIEFTGPSCDLTEPPAEAGETFSKFGRVTTAGRVYPRLSEMPAEYTGYQILWSSINGAPRQRSVVYVQAGRVVSTQPPPDVPFCKSGEKSAKTGCTPRREMLQVSFPPGCAARTVAANVLPKDCMESFQAEFKLHDVLKD
jgi:hypothetical protein